MAAFATEKHLRTAHVAGPFVFSRRPGASWRYVSDTGGTGGTVCPPTAPAGLLDVWKLPRSNCTS